MSDDSSHDKSIKWPRPDVSRKPSRAKLIAEIDALRKRIGPVPGDSTDLIREDRHKR